MHESGEKEAFACENGEKEAFACEYGDKEAFACEHGEKEAFVCDYGEKEAFACLCEDENGEKGASCSMKMRMVRTKPFCVRMVRQRPLLACVKNGNGEKEGFVYLTHVVESS